MVLVIPLVHLIFLFIPVHTFKVLNSRIGDGNSMALFNHPDLQRVKNLRDLASSVEPEGSDLGISIQSRKVIRTGCPSKATKEDTQYLMDKVGMKESFDLIDLRSPKEWQKDQMLFKSPIYEDYKNYRFSKLAKNWIRLEGNTTSFNIFTGSGLQEMEKSSLSEKKQNKR